MKHIVIIPNPNRDRDLSVTKSISEILLSYGALVYIDKKYECDLSDSVERYDSFPCDAELIIVVGGDGSVLDASVVSLAHDVPLLGVNLGKVGYLSEVEPNNLAELSRILAGEYTIKEKMLLTVVTFKDGVAKESERLAVNDVII